MDIVNTSIEEFGVEVTAQAGDQENSFYVQLTDGTYRSDLGCWITTADSEGDINADDYENFDMSEIIDAAEDAYSDHYEEKYTEKEIKFNCAIADDSVIMRIDNESGEVELLTKSSGYVGSYQRRYSDILASFDSEEEALEYADKFRTGEYQDTSGLYALMQDLQNHE